jgi:thiol-disulfide isomerase/thioredoxin
MRRMTILAGILLWSALGGMTAAAASPDVTLNGIDGTPHHFSEFIGRGKWTVLVVWGPRCPPCIEEMPGMQKFHDANLNRASVLGVAVDFPSFGHARRDEVAKFAEDYLISFPLLLGDGEVFARFAGDDLLGVPTTVIYDRKGAIVARHTGSVSQDMVERFINKWDAPEPGK